MTKNTTNPNTHTNQLTNQLTSRITGHGSQPASKFTLNPLNFRSHPEMQQIAADQSLHQLGWIQQVIVNSTTGHVIDGELRIQRALAISPDEPVPFIEVELSLEEEKLALLSLDPISGMATLREAHLKQLLADAKPIMPPTSPIQDWLLRELKQQRRDESKLRTAYEDKDSEVKLHNAHSYQEQYQVQPDSCFTLGEHKLLCADSTQTENLARLMDGKKAAISFTSPPYNANLNVDTRPHKKTPKYAHDTDAKNHQEYISFLQSHLDSALKVSHFVLINLQLLANNKNPVLHFMAANAEKLADVFVWDKLHAQPALKPNITNSQFELVLAFSHSGTRTIGTRFFHGSLSNVYSQLRSQATNPYHQIHKAIFPLHLPTHFMTSLTNEQEIILDCFAGLGTTIIAAQNTNRIAYAVELDPLYAATALHRFQQTFPNIPIKKLM